MEYLDPTRTILSQYACACDPIEAPYTTHNNIMQASGPKANQSLLGVLGI